MMAAASLTEVEVLGLTEDVNDDFLLLYFENKRRSGGGRIQLFTRDKSEALITFSNPADAEGVLSKREHSLYNVTVQVRRPPPWDPRKVALCGLDVDTQDTLLELYMEAVSGRDAISIVRSADKTSALVSFSEELNDEDFHRLLTRVEVKKLHARSVSVRRVRVCSEILVEDIQSQISPELLEMYFESKRSGGGALRSVTMLRKNTAAVVSFSDWNVVDQVLCRQHILQNCQLSVSPYYPDLLGSPSNDIAEERLMEEESTKIPDTVNLHQNGRQVIGAPAEDSEMQSVHGIDEKMFVVGLCDLEEAQNDTLCCDGSELPTTSEVPLIRPESPLIRPEVPQIRSHSEDLAFTVNRTNELVSLKPLQSPNTDKDDDWGHLPHPLRTPMSWEGEERGATSAMLSSSVHEAEVVMEAAELSFMQKYHHDLLAEFDAVTIFPLEEDDRFGFKVIGDVSSCRTVVELLQHIVSSLSSRTIILEYPWVSHFLLESEGQSILRDTEKQHQCIIDTSQISWKVLDCVYIDPWSFVPDSTNMSPVQSMVTDEEPDNPLIQANMEGIKRFASLLKSEENPIVIPSTEASTTIGKNVHGVDSEEDLYTDKSSKADDSTASEVKDEELDRVCQMSREEYRDRELDEEAQLLLAIQRSMDTQGVSTQENDDEELQRVLEISIIEHQNEDTEDCLQRALEMSIQDQRSHDSIQPINMREKPAFHEQTSNLARIRVLAGDETSIVVAVAALRKAITSKLNVVSLEETNSGQDMSQIMAALEKKHKVKMTKSGRELQIHGFLHGPNQCRQEMSQILNALQERGQPKVEVMDLDADRDLEMTDVPETSEEYQLVIQPFLSMLDECKLAIDVLQVQKVHNPLLYNQYQLKKLRMVMTDPNKPAERILYHGTSETSAREICLSGFNRSFSGKNATLYGEGVYFASEPELSIRNHYSPPNKDGKKFVLVARVLTGDFTQGKENMRTPPLIANTTGDVPRRYDSLVNSMQDPKIFVIFNDTQAYPDYLITCRNLRDNTK